jgi:hypothetical protein
MAKPINRPYNAIRVATGPATRADRKRPALGRGWLGERQLLAAANGV